MKALPLFEIILYITSYRLQNTQPCVKKTPSYADKSTVEGATGGKFSILPLREMVVYIALLTTAIFLKRFDITKLEKSILYLVKANLLC